MKAPEESSLGTVVPKCWRTVKLPRQMTGEPGVCGGRGWPWLGQSADHPHRVKCWRHFRGFVFVDAYYGKIITFDCHAWTQLTMCLNFTRSSSYSLHNTCSTLFNFREEAKMKCLKLHFLVVNDRHDTAWCSPSLQYLCFNLFIVNF